MILTVLFTFLTLIGLGEVKLQENILSNLIIKKYLFLQKHLPSLFELLTWPKKWRFDGLFDDFLSEVRSQHHPSDPPPSAHFYCYYRPPEGRSSPAWPWSTVRCGASQHSNQFLVMGRVECGGWRVLSRARSLALNKWTAGATPI
jgi:hypothetical protein